MPKVEFVGQSVRDGGNIAASPSRLVNAYREPVLSGERTGFVIKSAPGFELHRAAMETVAALDDVGGRLFAVLDSGLYRVGAGLEFLGGVDDPTNATIAGNNGAVTVTAGGAYRVWDGDTMVSPAPGAFSGFGGHDYIGNYTVLTQANGRRFQWSEIADAKTLPGLNFSTADGRDDKLIRPMALNGVLYLFKQTSHEIWYVTGGAGAEAFERQAGGVYDVGLKAYGLITRIPGGAFFVGDDGRAHLLSGGVSPVSTPAVEVAIKTSTPIACVTYEDFGHTFCAIVFSDRAAWVYDIATGEWHERAERAGLFPWTVTSTAKSGGVWYAGRGRRILRFANVPQDDEWPLVREITSRTLTGDGRMFTADLLEMFPRQGFNMQALELEVSRDGGLTWTEPKPRQIGPVGAYGQRVTWRGLGRSRQFNARVRASEGDDFTINADCLVTLR